MKIQRLRNLTTGILHTEIGDVYEDLETITGQQGLMTHMLPRAREAVLPWLKRQFKDSKFWEEKWDPGHVGEYVLPTPTEKDREEMSKIYHSLPNPLEEKKVAVVLSEENNNE